MIFINMALSAKETFSNPKDLIGGSTRDSRHNPNNQPLNIRTYAQTVKDQQRDPFLLDSTEKKDDRHNLTPAGKIFIEAKDKNSIVIPFAAFNSLNLKEKALNKCLREQYPNGLGIRMRKVGKEHHYIELNFVSSEDREEALKKEFKLNNVRIPVERTLHKDTSVIRVGISNIPYEGPDFLKPRLIEIFQKYGEILEIGLHHTVEGNWFVGKGFVTLCKPKDKEHLFKELQARIPAWEGAEELHLVYTNMKPICNRCHVEDHVFADCPITLQHRKACFICKSLDHLIADCPDSNRNRKRAKRDAPPSKQVTIMTREAATKTEEQVKVTVAGDKVSTNSNTINIDESAVVSSQDDALKSEVSTIKPSETQLSSTNADANSQDETDLGEDGLIFDENAGTQQSEMLEEGGKEPSTVLEFASREEEVVEVHPEEDVMLEDIDSDSEMNDMLILPEDSVEEVSRKRAANAAALAKRKLLRHKLSTESDKLHSLKHTKGSNKKGSFKSSPRSATNLQ